MNDKKVQRAIKRLFDIVFSLVLFICASPFLLIAMAVAVVRLFFDESHPLDRVLDTVAFVLLIVLYVLPMIRKRMERKDQEVESKE